jgi:hypothetical protein
VDDENNQQRPRASLRGKGREILLGQHSGADRLPDFDDSPEESEQDQALPEHVDPAALKLTPEEAAALLDFSPSSPAYEADQTFPVGEAVPESVAPDLPPAEEGTLLDWLAEPSEPDVYQVLAEESLPSEEASSPVGEGLPLSERDRPAVSTPQPYRLPPQVEVMVPQAPEIWEEPAEEAVPAAEEPADEPIGEPVLTGDNELAVEEHEGGLVVPEGAVMEGTPAEGITDPFSPVYRRQPAEDLFEETSKPDDSLLTTLVDDARIRRLWEQIETLQEELVKQVHGDRGATDVYQQELLRASSMLLESRANYDDARAIVYRVLADLNRQRKVDADIMRYRPLLLNYYLGWGISLAVLVLLKSMFSGVADSVGVGNLAALYYPMLLGIAGALISGYLTLDRHTTKLRDFDPIHISWYLFNPLLGGVMGLLMFLLASIANGDLLQQTASDPERAIAYLLCVGAGMYQNNVLGQLNEMVKRFGRTGTR